MSSAAWKLKHSNRHRGQQVKPFNKREERVGCKATPPRTPRKWEGNTTGNRNSSRTEPKFSQLRQHAPPPGHAGPTTRCHHAPPPTPRAATSKIGKSRRSTTTDKPTRLHQRPPEELQEIDLRLARSRT
ncbi:hypothetical protein F2Q69_00047238 [Brassica cretica]|uniref:Uncharacterized protein n=1 Tax=Brassica cretica TaxID=69181 RepID=A0A8S9PPV3_BRACR|nr:hypothetical protein F2Q69_00047238 [Brassica cretica]